LVERDGLRGGVKRVGFYAQTDHPTQSFKIDRKEKSKIIYSKYNLSISSLKSNS
jgi:hypothetical protein